MEYKPLSELQHVAYVTRGWGTAKMSRRERLERWAALLEQQPTRHLRPLVRVEFLPRREREMLRRDESPLTIAYADPVLRHQGLDSDRLGAALTFFSLSDREAHYLLCDCHYHGGMTMTPDTVARRIRGIAGRVTFLELWERATSYF